MTRFVAEQSRMKYGVARLRASRFQCYKTQTNSVGKNEFDITQRKASLGISKVIPHELLCQRLRRSPLPLRLRAELVGRRSPDLARTASVRDPWRTSPHRGVGRGSPVTDRALAASVRDPRRTKSRQKGLLTRLGKGLLTKPVPPRSETLGERTADNPLR
jgi:hypothetical protein